MNDTILYTNDLLLSMYIIKYTVTTKYVDMCLYTLSDTCIFSNQQPWGKPAGYGF